MDAMPTTAKERRALARRWADRVVRVYAAAALRVAGFSSSALALATLPAIADASEASEDEAVREARSRVNAAFVAVLGAREVPQTEHALLATLAAREALALIAVDEPTDRHLQRIVEALHTIA